MCDPEDPLFMPSPPFARPAFLHFSVTQDPTFTFKSQISGNVKPKASKLAKIGPNSVQMAPKNSVPKLQIVPKFSSHG